MSISMLAPLDVRASTERRTAHRLPVSWATVVVCAVVIAYVDGYWTTSLRGAVGAIEGSQRPFTRWLRDSTLMLPLFLLGVLAALALTRRWVGRSRRELVQLAVAGVLDHRHHQRRQHRRGGHHLGVRLQHPGGSARPDPCGSHHDSRHRPRQGRPERRGDLHRALLGSTCDVDGARPGRGLCQCGAAHHQHRSGCVGSGIAWWSTVGAASGGGLTRTRADWPGDSWRGDDLIWCCVGSSTRSADVHSDVCRHYAVRKQEDECTHTRAGSIGMKVSWYWRRSHSSPGC